LDILCWLAGLAGLPYLISFQFSHIGFVRYEKEVVSWRVMVGFVVYSVSPLTLAWLAIDHIEREGLVVALLRGLRLLLVVERHLSGLALLIA
jgi:hypothetical protein